MKVELLQLTGSGRKHIRRDFGSVRSSVEVIKAELEAFRRPLPHAAKRVVFADDQPPALLQDRPVSRYSDQRSGRVCTDMSAMRAHGQLRSAREQKPSLRGTQRPSNLVDGRNLDGP